MDEVEHRLQYSRQDNNRWMTLDPQIGTWEVKCSCGWEASESVWVKRRGAVSYADDVLRWKGRAHLLEVRGEEQLTPYPVRPVSFTRQLATQKQWAPDRQLTREEQFHRRMFEEAQKEADDRRRARYGLSEDEEREQHKREMERADAAREWTQEETENLESLRRLGMLPSSEPEHWALQLAARAEGDRERAEAAALEERAAYLKERRKQFFGIGYAVLVLAVAIVAIVLVVNVEPSPKLSPHRSQPSIGGEVWHYPDGLDTEEIALLEDTLGVDRDILESMSLEQFHLFVLEAVAAVGAEKARQMEEGLQDCVNSGDC